MGPFNNDLTIVSMGIQWKSILGHILLYDIWINIMIVMCHKTWGHPLIVEGMINPSATKIVG